MRSNMRRRLRMRWQFVALARSLAAYLSRPGFGARCGRAASRPPRKASRTAAEPSPSEMLKRYLLDQAKLHFDARRKAIAAIKTPADVERRQKELRAFFLASLGDLPERTPLNPQVVGTLKRDGYRVEKVIFESRPRHHVTGNLVLAGRARAVPGRAASVRPQRQRQGPRDLSAHLHLAGQERHGGAVL